MMVVKETLLVKHAVTGRMLLDSKQMPLVFTCEQMEQGGFVFTVEVPESAAAMGEEIVRLKEELNVFVFREPAGQPVQKTWFYVYDGPVRWEPAARRLTLTAKSCIAYDPTDYLA
ncbi:hypothetical protein [Paenibacillus sp. y28]|uniref:hypothetical protein n=1 Tax=Paenibacillus sp. y28 TaxID=3129110 RepID=UPI0030182AE2